MELRKHYCDISSKEKDIINKSLKGKEFQVTGYTTFRKQERKITEDEINRVFKDYKIIEVHIKNEDVRVLLRGNKVEQGNINICVVVSLTNGRLITCYYNHHKDIHTNLDTSKYTKYINILNLLKNNTYSN